VGQLQDRPRDPVGQARADTIFCVDNMQNATDLDAAARTAEAHAPVAIDLWVGNRTGILPGAPAVALAEGLQA
jgi:hypothetical protein